jgi:uncharacterized membrane protein
MNATTSRSHPLRDPAIWMLSGAFAVAYSLYALVRHWHFHSSAYDLGIFDQVIWHLSRFERPASSIAGHASIFSDHFHPIIVLLAPLYWLRPGPETLLVAQAILLAASLVPVFAYAESRVGRAPGLWIAASYGLFWAIQKTAAFDFHEVAFAPLIIAAAILALESRRWRWLWACMVALCLIKEDLIPLVGMLGLRLMSTGHVYQGAAAIGLSAAAFGAIMAIVMPALGGEDAYPYWATHLQALEGGPLSVLAQLVTPTGKLMTLAMWVVPFVLVPLRSPLILLALPIALSRLLSGSPNHWGMSFHYSAPLAPVVAMAAADGLARLVEGSTAHTRATILRSVPVVMCLLCAVLPGRLPLWRVFAPSHYRATAADRVGYEALAVIPAEASVVAQDAVVPHLSRRKDIYGLQAASPDAEYVIVTEHRTPWPTASHAEIRHLLDERKRRGYRVAFERDGWTVLALPRK